MTATGGSRLDDWLAPAVSARRLALVRIIVAGYALLWLAGTAPDLLTRSRFAADRFEPVGLAAWTGVVPPTVVVVVLGLALVSGATVLLGRGHRLAGPAFALGLGWLLSYRNSWGHMSHAEHLLVVHVGILALAPAGDALRFGRPSPPSPPLDGRYGWPLRLMMLVTVATYVIAGLAKLRIGGLAWLGGDAVQLHVAHEALRTARVGAEGSPLTGRLLPHAGVFTAMAGFTVLAELGAPLALVGGRLRVAWLLMLWAMHVGIGLVMHIGFLYPLTGVAFASFMPLERWWARLAQRWRPPAASPPSGEYDGAGMR